MRAVCSSRKQRKFFSVIRSIGLGFSTSVLPIATRYSQENSDPLREYAIKLARIRFS